MVDPQHPLTPPKELINEWRAESYHQDYCGADDYFYHKIAEWGWEQRNATVPQELHESADQELDARCKWLNNRKRENLGQVIAPPRCSSPQAVELERTGVRRIK